MSSTRAEIRQRLGKVLGACETGTTTAAGDSTSVIDTTNWTDSTINANYFDNWFCIMTSGDRSGQIRRVSSFSGSAGDFTLADALTGAPGSGATFELHAYRPAHLNDAIDAALARCYYWTYYYPTLVTDGDMEASGVTNWTGSSSTPTKSTTVAKYGTQSLVSTNSGADGYCRTASMSVTAGDAYYAEVAVRPDNFAVSFIAYDVTNSAVIEQIDHSGGREWKRLWMDFSIPSGCNQIQMRLSASSASAVTYWDTLILQQADEQRLALPSWVTNENMVQWVEQRIAGRDQASGVAFVDEETWRQVLPAPSVESDDPALSPFYLLFPAPISNQGFRIRAVRPYGALSADSTSTTAAKEWAVAGALLELLRMRRLRAPIKDAKEWQTMINGYRKDWERLCREYQPKVASRIRGPWDA